MYAIFDLETTGLQRHDRVVEIAIVHADEAGTVTDEWHTLINPQRDLGPVHVHQVRAADARQAPSFRDVAGAIAARLHGRIPVAHNIGFDAGMLSNEFMRLQCEVPNLAEFGVCTMAWAYEFLGPGRRSLRHCCEMAGIANDRPHEALSDALATAELLAHYLAINSESAAPWAQLQSTATDAAWPTSFVSPAAEVHRGAYSTPINLLELLPAQRAAAPDTEAIQDYMSALDRALIDDEPCASQAEAVVTIATNAGIGVQCALDWHVRYLNMRAAADASTRAPSEVYPKLVAIASVLGLGTDHVDDALRRPPPTLPFDFSPFTLDPGAILVLTGTFTDGKQSWSEYFRHAGLSVTDYVTKRTALVVAADPDTMSAKAKLARRYGIPVVRPESVARLLPRPATL